MRSIFGNFRKVSYPKVSKHGTGSTGTELGTMDLRQRGCAVLMAGTGWKCIICLRTPRKVPVTNGPGRALVGMSHRWLSDVAAPSKPTALQVNDRAAARGLGRNPGCPRPGAPPWGLPASGGPWQRQGSRPASRSGDATGASLTHAPMAAGRSPRRLRLRPRPVTVALHGHADSHGTVQNWQS